ncbi:MAG: hypothetical protein R6X20_15010 [Phycisphaerae bacterium]
MAQEQKRDQTVRLPNPSAQPFVAALKTVRFFAVLFFWVTMVCVLAHVAAFVLTEWVGVYRLAEEAADGPPAGEAVRVPAPWPGLVESTAAAAEPGELFPNVAPEQAASKPAAESGDAEAGGETAPETDAPPAGESEGTVAAPPNEAPDEETDADALQRRQVRARYYRKLTANVLGPARSVGILASILLAVTVFLYLQIALLGRLAGIRQLTRSLFLILLFLATVVPWGSVFEDVQASSLFDFERLLSTHAMGMGDSDDWVEAARYYGRFLVFPSISVILLALAGIHFAGGYSRSVLANE